MGEAALDISLDDHSLLEDFERDSSANDLSPDEKLALFHQLQASPSVDERVDGICRPWERIGEGWKSRQFPI